METKYNLEDEVLIRARVRAIGIKPDGITYKLESGGTDILWRKEEEIYGQCESSESLQS